MRKWISLFLLATTFCLFSEEETTNSEITMSDGAFGHGTIKNTLTSRTESLEGRVADIEQKTILDKYQGKTLITRCSEDEDSFAIYGDFLWWKAQNDGFHYVLDIVAERTSKLISLPYEWEPGFRLGLGYNSCYDGWDVYALWTYFHNKTSQTKRNYDFNDESSMIAFWFPSAVAAFMTGSVDFPHIGYAKADWDIDYDTVELLFDRDFFIGKSLALKPYFAVKALFLDQKFKIRYEDPEPGGGFESFFPIDVRLENKYWGVGPKVGFDTNWYLLKQLKLYANLSADLVYGERKETLNYHSADENFQFGGSRDDFYALTPTLSLALGAAFTYCFDESTSLNLHVAWESLYIWNQFINQSLIGLYTYVNLNEPLHMQGLTAGAEIRF